MKAPARLLLCLVLSLLTVGRAGGETDSPATTLSPEAVADFQWFGTLGFPDVRGCPAVRVATGQWMQAGSQPPRNRFVAAFLLRHDGDGNFAVLTGDLFTREFTTTKSGTPEHEQVGYEEQPLAAHADAYLEWLARVPDKESDEVMRRFGELVAERVEVFTWAWACWRNNLDDRAAALYARAAAMPARFGREEPETTTFRERLERDLGLAMIWRATLAFGDPKVSRAQLLENFERIARNYPRAEHAALARETADRLRTMVAEDAAHAAKPVAAPESLPPEERVAELIFRLRDQNGHQFRQPGYCNIFDDFGGAMAKGNEPDAAHQLAALGHAAVPPLIAALEDKSFSRSVGYWRNFAFSHHVLTVGDCALQILERIARRTFFTPKTTSSYLSKDGDVAAVKAEAAAWWQSLQLKGERQTLIDTVSQGGRNAARQASILRDEYPDAALAAMLQGAKNSDDGYARATLLEQIGKVPGDEAVPFLEEELHASKHLDGRLAAARALCQHGQRARAVTAMIAEWGKSFPAQGGRDFGDDVIGVGLPGFLANCGQAEAIQALGRNLIWRPENARLQVIDALQPKNPNAPGTAPVDDGVVEPDTDGKPVTEAAVETLLVAELEDTEESSAGYSNLHFGKTYLQPCVCDFAGQALARRLAGKYTFPGTGTFQDNERVRIARINVWRGEHALTLLPTPPESKIPAAQNEQVLPVLKTLAGSGSAEERDAASADLTQLGLSALAPLRTLLATLPPADPGRARLLAGERILASVVADATLDGTAAENSEAWQPLRDGLAALRGKPLTSAALSALEAEATGKLPWAADAFQLRALRDEGTDGVRIIMELRPVAPFAKGTKTNSQVHVHCNVNGNDLLGETSFPPYDEIPRAGACADFARSVDEALAAPANQPFSCVLAVGGESF